MRLTNWGELEPEISDLIGKTFKSVLISSDELIFIGDCGTFRFYHDQDCCESVRIFDIAGDIKDLENSPILLASCLVTLVPLLGWNQHTIGLQLVLIHHLAICTLR